MIISSDLKQRTAEKKYPTDKLAAYVRLAETYRSDKRTIKNKSVNPFMPLAATIPIAALAMAPIAGVQAQCLMNATAVTIDTATNPNNVPGGNVTSASVDLDMDGTPDIKFIKSGGNLFVSVLSSSVELLASSLMTAGNTYFPAPIAAAPVAQTDANWRGTATLPDNNRLNQGTLDFNDTAGGWAGGGTGSLAVRLNGDQIGFIELIYTDTTIPGERTISFGNMGVQTPAEATNNLPSLTCEALPVELSSFTGAIETDIAVLAWTTVSELNNAGFEVQRSTDGVDFQKVGWVEGQGNASEAIQYGFKDNKIQENTNYYYRLKQIDLDGQYDFSSIINLQWKVDNAWGVGDVVPNPITNFASIEIKANNEAHSKLSVYDAIGNLVHTQQESLKSGANQIELHLNNLQAGAYFLKIEANKDLYYKKFIVAK